MSYNRIVPNLSNEAYHSDKEAVSNSQLGRLAESPAKFFDPFEPSADMIFGTLIHAIMLEPETFTDVAAIMPPGLNKGTGMKERVKQFHAQNPGKHVISTEDFEELVLIRKELLNHPIAGPLLAYPGRTEHSIFWEDEETGVKCRCRPDYWRDDGIVLDLKKTRDASTWGFSKSVWDYGYDRQSAMYSDGIKAVTGEYPQAFVFIAIEPKTDWVRIECHNAEEDVLSTGRTRYRRLLKTYKQCKEANVWPKYMDPQIHKLRLPNYAKVD